MKRLISVSIILTFVFITFPSSASAATKVRGYTTKRGTYVAPHFKSTPNKTKLDNYSTKGNYNPYTGKKGTINLNLAPKKHK